MVRIIAILLLFGFNLNAQTSIPVGSWQSHFTYLTATSVEQVGTKIFTGANQLTSFDLIDNEYVTYSKVNGLSDVGINLLRYDQQSGYLFIVYTNGNIDLWKDGQFINMADLKNYNVTGSKKINGIYFKNQLAYFSTDFGIIVINPNRREIKESYILQENSSQLEIRGLVDYNQYFYAVTNKGVFAAPMGSTFLQNYATWKKMNTGIFKHILNHNNSLFVANDTLLFKLEADSTTTQKFHSKSSIVKLRSGNGRFYLCESNDKARGLRIFDNTGLSIDSFFSVNPLDVMEQADSNVWVADEWRGLMFILNRNAYPYHPNGPYTNSMYNLNVLNNELYASAGGEVSWVFTYNGGGISKLNQNGEWSYFNRFIGTPALDSINDIMEVALDKRTNTLYGASFHDGLWEYNQNTNVAVNYKNTPYIQSYSGYRIAGLAMDKNSNLWMTNYGAPEQLVVKKADGTWQKFGLPYNASEKAASQIIIDDENQKWIVAPRGIGVFVYNDNNTIDNKNDDQVKLLKVGVGQGNLANNEVNCIAKDKNGKIWIGTIDGIAIINCPESIFSTEGCDAELKIVKYDLDAGLLFQKESVQTIAVDGANNKWIGTSNGVWLISDDAEKIIKRFNAENSPLPSNDVNRIIVHPTTGEVFIATNAGLVSYRGEATDGVKTNEDLLVFPNPVPSGYSGTISIKGLVANSDVRITDAAGQLVYRTTAQGGQAVWNGKNYLGEKPRTGIYYVFVTNSDGSETNAGKFIINE